MITTSMTELVGCTVPIQLAGMGPVCSDELCAAVSEAGAGHDHGARRRMTGHDRAVEFPNVSEALAEQQYADGLAAFRRGDNAACRRLSAAALTTAAVAGSERGKALGHLGLSRADFRDGDYPGG